MAEPLMRPVIRQTPENHTETPPACDQACARWGDLAHAHVCPDGLYEPGPFLDITAWCSCGVRVGWPVHLDTRMEEDYRVRMEAAGHAFSILFKAHMKFTHDIDINKDKRWLKALGTAV